MCTYYFVSLIFKRVVKISNPDMEDWEIYEESLNQKRNEKRRIPATKNMDVI